MLISTTRQWNPGDEFISFGIQRLLQEVLGEFNPVIFNRHPDIRPEYSWRNPLRRKRWTQRVRSIRSLRFKRLVDAFVRFDFRDNSFKDDTDGGAVDLVVFAGTPEWYGARVEPLNDFILRSRVPTLILGIGSGISLTLDHLGDRTRRVLAHARMISVRDESTEVLLKDYSPARLPCPALLCAPPDLERRVESVRSIGLIYATSRAVVNNRVSPRTHAYMQELYAAILQRLGRDFAVELVLHYIDEIDECTREFPGMSWHYSYDARDYLEIYRRFDLVVGPRVHGIGAAASLGVPGLLLAHDKRSDTVRGFGAELITAGEPVETALGRIEAALADAAARSAQLRRLKTETHAAYLRHVRNGLEGAGLVVEPVTAHGSNASTGAETPDR